MAQNDPPPVIRSIEEGGQRYDPLSTFELEYDRAPNPIVRAYTDAIDAICDFFTADTWVLDCEDLVLVILITGLVAALLTGSIVWSFTSSIEEEETNHVALELSSMSISNFDVSRDEIRGHCMLSFNITNHGDSQLYFGKALLSVYFEHELLWINKTDPLYLDIGKSAILIVRMKENSIAISDEFVATAIMGSRNSPDGATMFLVKFDGVLRDGVGLWMEERDQMYATCGWVHMTFQNATTLIGGPVKCKPRVF